jgi:hypothetical protein
MYPTPRVSTVRELQLQLRKRGAVNSTVIHHFYPRDMDFQHGTSADDD